MKKSRKQASSTVVPVLLGIIVILVLLVGIMVYFVINQKPSKETAVPQVQVPAVPVTEKNSEYPDNYQIQFEQEWMVNKDFKGYLTLEGTALSTNVVQGTDNVFYREHGFDGGTDSPIAFLDYRVNIETPSTQTLIYLPHANNHEKYGELVKYKDPEYCKAHPVISFNSLYRNAKYKVFAVALFPSGYEGIPFQTCMVSSDKTQLTTLVQQAWDHSILDIPVDVRDTDELLTVISEDLSLMDENGKYARIAVFARKIRSGESETVNTQKVVVKPNKHMPQSWYDQILHNQHVSTVNAQIRDEAANWFSDFELSKIADAELERMMNARKAEYKKYLSKQEMLLSAEEKAYLYEKRLNEAENPVLTLDLQNVTAKVGDEVVLNVHRTPRDTSATYTWTSSDQSVVSVEGNGVSAKLKALRKGSVSVTVTSGNATAVCKVEVRGKEQLLLNPSSMTIFVDNSYNIKASTDIQHASSGNTEIAKVTINKNLATVMGVAPGQTTITLTNRDGASAICEVTVQKYQLALDKTTLEMKTGNRRNIYVSTGTAANWYVDNTSVINMSIVEEGKAVLVEAIGAGTATVTATARNGIQATCKITVDGNEVAFSTNHMDMQKGEFREMQVTRGNVVDWEVSDDSVVQVCILSDGKNVEVEALECGTATVKAYGSDGSVAAVTVNVSAPKESLTITPYAMTVTQGEMRNISVTSGSASNWVSSDPDVAEVFVVGDGTMAQVEGRNPGTATITVYDSYGGWVDCIVTVEEPVSKLVVGPGSVHMGVGDFEQLSVTSGKAIDWETSNESIVGIYVVGGDLNNIRIKANGAGTAQITGYGVDGSTAVCNVIVNEPYVDQLSLDKSSMTLTEGDLADLYVSSGYVSNWAVSNPEIAEVYAAGDGSMVQIRGSAAGTAVITAYADDGSSVSCTVTVEAAYIAPAAAEDPLTLNTTTISMEEGAWAEIYVTGGHCVDWNTTNQNIVRIYEEDDPARIKIKAESAGTAQIIAYASDGTTTVCEITVTAAPEPEYMVDSDPLFFTEEEPAPAPETEPKPESDPENLEDNNADEAAD